MGILRNLELMMFPISSKEVARSLKSARSKEFRTEEGRAKAAANLKEKGIDALVVIGGDGTFTGGNFIAKEHGINVVGIPATIDTT